MDFIQNDIKIGGDFDERFSFEDFSYNNDNFGIFGLSTLPFLSIIVQYIDSITGFSSGNGYLTNNMDYLFKSPLIYIGGFFVFSIILAIIYLVYSFFKAKRG